VFRVMLWLAGVALVISAALLLLMLGLARSRPPLALVFSQYELARGSWTVYLDPATGARLERRTPLHESDVAVMALEPAPRSPDGLRTVRPSVTEDGVDLFIEDAAGARTRLTHFSDFPPGDAGVQMMRSNTVPLWSPDGQWISFISADPLAHLDLYLITATGDELRRIYADIRTPTPLSLRWVALPEQPFQPWLALGGVVAAVGLWAWLRGRRAAPHPPAPSPLT
jgi:hypothetical protein